MLNYHISLLNIYISVLLNSIVSGAYYVDLIDNGPIVKGGNITFTAVLYDDDRQASGDFTYTWTDTAVPVHYSKSSSKSPIDTWTVLYNDTVYPPGPYVAQVEVCKYYLNLICYSVASNRIRFYINDTLNGDIQLIQQNKSRNGIFVSNTETVVHDVSLKKTDADMIKQAPTVLTYWFVDCTYYGFRRDFSFPFNYSQADKEHKVEALVVADFTPLPPPPTTTTTTTTTTIKPTTSTKPSATTVTTAMPSATSVTAAGTTAMPNTTTVTTAGTTAKPITTSVTEKMVYEAQLNSSSTLKSIVKREIDLKMLAKAKIFVNVNGSLQPYVSSFPYVCNETQVIKDPKKIYGYFSKKIKVRAPVSKVNVTGNNWLQHGDLLTLNVNCHGSKTMTQCVQYYNGVYNVSGNESCSTSMELEKCEFMIQRYFGESMQHTIVIIIENDVSKVVTPVTITVYEVKKQAQLSVIFVPVTFSIVAVVLIVFGVAYYIQNRSRFIVEVADFNFGQNYTELEYKTFRERLRDSIANAFFTRAPTPSSSEVPVWPPGRKYGSMTS